MRRAVVIVAATVVVAAWMPPVQAATTTTTGDASATTRAVSAEGPVRAMTPRASAKGGRGQTLTVTPTSGLSAFGQTVRVSGRGFSETVGIYVGLCVLRPRGVQPSPCGGGMDQDGSSQASAWISSNPPPYGANLAIPYKRGGKFSVRIKVSPRIGNVDCRITRCAVVARADHLRTFDRSWDVAVPVTFR